MENLTPYDILDLRSNASLAEIKTRFRILVLQCHPDKVDKIRTPWITEEYFNTIRDAYEQLCYMRREEYCPSDKVNYQDENIANFIGKFELDVFNDSFDKLHKPLREFTNEEAGYSEFETVHNLENKIDDKGYLSSDKNYKNMDFIQYEKPDVKLMDIETSLSNSVNCETYDNISTDGIYGIVTLGKMDITTPSGLIGTDIASAFGKTTIYDSEDPNMNVDEMYNRKISEIENTKYIVEDNKHKKSIDDYKKFRKSYSNTQKNEKDFNEAIASVRLLKNSF